jgi:hypothetical protein
MDGTRTVVASLPAENTIQGWPSQTVRPRLGFRCKEGEVEAHVAAGLRPEVESDPDVTTALIRLDDDAPVAAALAHSTDGKGLFFRYPVNVALELFGRRRMIFRFTPFNSNPQEAVFDVRGFEAALRPVGEACEWDPRKILAEALEELRGKLKSPNPRTRVGAARELGRSGQIGRSLIPALVAALDDAELDVRVAAATALGELGPAAAEAIPALEAALADPGKKIRVVAEEALEQIRKQPAQ